jgi:addiction module HigA family antidote
VKTTIRKTSAVEVRRMRKPPTHPGEMLLEEFLKPLGISQAAAAAKMGITTNRLNEIVKGKRGVSADTAWRLSAFLGTSPEVWMNLQMYWDLWHAARARKSA